MLGFPIEVPLPPPEFKGQSAKDEVSISKNVAKDDSNSFLTIHIFLVSNYFAM